MGINYEETFCAAVDEIVSQRIQGLSFNATLICKIVDATDAENGIYTVNDGSVEFAAYSSNTSYQENDQVYVIVPNNNREEQCLIIGKKMYSGSTSYTFTSPFGTIIDITENIIDIPIKKKGLIANYGMDETKQIDHQATMSEICYEISVLVANNRDIISDEMYEQLKVLYNDYDNLQKENNPNAEKIAIAQTNIYDFYNKNLKYIPVPESSILYVSSTELNSQKIQSITLWEYEPSYPIAGYDRLGLKGEFCSLLQNLNVVEGHYGLRLLLTASLNGPVSKDSSKTGVYELILDSDDMNGNKFDFKGFYPQEKVFDISNFNAITKLELQFYQEPGSFKNKNGKAIKPEVSENLFVNDPYICFGYDITQFGTDKVQIFSVSSQAYSAAASEEQNTKVIKLRWVHQDAKKVVRSLDYSDIVALGDAEVRWYHYKRGAETSDAYSGLYWERIPDDDEGFKNNDLSEYYFSPNLLESTEQIKVIVRQGAYYFISNILTFYNEQDVVNPATIATLTAFQIKPLAGNEGNYYRYNVGGNIANLGDSYEKRIIKAYYNDEELKNSTTSYIDWIIPMTGTMITVFDDSYYDWEIVPKYVLTTDTKFQLNKEYYIYSENSYLKWECPEEAIGKNIPPRMYYTDEGGSYHMVTANEFEKNKEYYVQTNYVPITVTVGNTIDDYSVAVYERDYSSLIVRKRIVKTADGYTNYFVYGISPFYSQSYLNNSIIADATISGVSYSTNYQFHFGPSGTSGSPYTLTLNIDPCNEPYLIYDNKDHVIKVTAKLFNYENNEEIELDGTNIEISAIPEDTNKLNLGVYVKVPGRPSVATRTVSLNKDYDFTNDYSGAVLQAKIYQNGMELTTYCSIPIIKNYNSSGSYSMAAVPTSIIYDSSGYVYYYKDKLKLFNNTGQEVASTWSLLYNDGEEWKTVKESTKYTPQLYKNNQNEYFLFPPVMYVDGMPETVLVGQDKYNQQWYQKLIITKNRYPSAMIDRWNGSTVALNTAEGSILSTMIAAGSKNDQNQFSGVMLGDWSGSSVEGTIASQTGLYGFRDGEMSFAFMEDGTAFMGRSGEGRILFDGTSGSIQSGNYMPGTPASPDVPEKPGSGMRIDLTEGHIDAYDFKLTSKSITLDSSPEIIDEDSGQIGPYFKITSPAYFYDEILGWVPSSNVTTDLVYMSDQKYELCSSNYRADSSGNIISGMIIDLIRGTIKIGKKFAITSDGIVQSANGTFTGISLSGITEGTNIDLGKNNYTDKQATLINGNLKNGSMTDGFLRECNISRSTFTYCTIDNNCNLHLRKLNNDGEITDDVFLYSLNSGIGIAQQVYLLSKDNLNVEVVTDVAANGNVTKKTLASLLKGNVGNVILVKQQSGNSFYEN